MLKHVVVPYVENTSYSTNKNSCVRRVHALYVSYFIEHNGDDEPHAFNKMQFITIIKLHVSELVSHPKGV